MSFDIRARHIALTQCLLDLPLVLTQVIIGYMGNEAVPQRIVRVHEGPVLGVYNDEIYYLTESGVYANETKLPILSRDLLSIDKWTNGRYLVSYRGERWCVYDGTTMYDLPNSLHVQICYDKIYFTDTMWNLYEHVSQWEYRLIGHDVWAWGRYGDFLHYICTGRKKWIHFPNKNQQEIPPDTHSVHVYGGQHYYVKTDSLQSDGFHFDLMCQVSRTHQLDHCVWIMTQRLDYVWDLQFQTVYILDEHINGRIRNGQCYWPESDSIIVYQ